MKALIVTLVFMFSVMVARAEETETKCPQSNDTTERSNTKVVPGTTTTVKPSEITKQ